MNKLKKNNEFVGKDNSMISSAISKNSCTSEVFKDLVPQKFYLRSSKNWRHFTFWTFDKFAVHFTPCFWLFEIRQAKFCGISSLKLFATSIFDWKLLNFAYQCFFKFIWRCQNISILNFSSLITLFTPLALTIKWIYQERIPSNMTKLGSIMRNKVIHIAATSADLSCSSKANESWILFFP